MTRCASFRPCGDQAAYLRGDDSPDAVSAFNVGDGDFSVVAAIVTRSGGGLIYRGDMRRSAVGAGFGLYIEPSGAVVFYISDGELCVGIRSVPTHILDGSLHTIVAIREQGWLTIHLDNKRLAVSPLYDRTDPPRKSLNLDSDEAIRIGHSRSVSLSEGILSFDGDVMNVSVWRCALSRKQQISAAFGRLVNNFDHLCGFWSLDGTLYSSGAGDQAQRLCIEGDSTAFDMSETSNIVFTSGPNDYEFVQIYGTGTPQTTLYNFAMPAAVPYFGLGIMADDDTPTCPVGTVVTLTDPNGTVYGTEDVNETNVYAKTVDGSLWAFMVAIPVAGTWQIALKSVAGSANYTCTAQTFPTLPGSFPYSSQEALEPLFGSASLSKSALAPASFAKSGWGWFAAAVAVLVAVIVVAVVVVTATSVAPAVIVGGIIFAGLVQVGNAISISNMLARSQLSLTSTTSQTIGLSGLSPEQKTVLWWDQNLPMPYDFSSTVYKGRLAGLYPNINLSAWNLYSESYLSGDCIPSTINSAASDSSVVYITASGHGNVQAILGWLDESGTGAMEYLLNSPDIADLSFAGRYIHLYACFTGVLDCATYIGMDDTCLSANPYQITGPGLGVVLVNQGAVAFFGYSDYVVVSANNFEGYQTIIDCDAAIDLAMLGGKTCDQAYQAAMAAYKSAYAAFIAEGDEEGAASCVSNMNGLVSPTTNSAYGNKNAFLYIGADD